MLNLLLMIGEDQSIDAIINKIKINEKKKTNVK